ncbi:hypothetical protein [Thiothrix sp.]|jgi:hypothetical protein|uniref:hypothetical protein n=1 Tax=Thiothrix sp. TaxID=1032 RepID=UPI002580292A|nr:hypothetical protein [Thiothrix sp.]
MDIEKFITLCQENTSDFSSMDYLNIAEHFDLIEEKNVLNQENIIKKIQSKIQKSLKVENGLNIRSFRKDLAVKYFLDENINRDYFNIIGSIAISLDLTDKLTKDPENWKSAIVYAKALAKLANHRSTDFAEHTYRKEKYIAEAIKFFSRMNIKILINDGIIIASKDDQQKIFNAIEYRAKKLGGNFIYNIINNTNHLLSEKQDRYFSQQNPNNKNPLVPWGYLLKVSLRYLNTPENKTKGNVIFKEIISISKHYAALYGFQEYSQFESLNLKNERLIDYLHKTSLADQIFNFEQLSTHHLREIIWSLYDTDEFDSIINTRMYLQVIHELITIQESCFPARFNLHDIAERLSHLISASDLSYILDSLSHKTEELNKGFISLNDGANKNHTFMPLIRIKHHEYIFIKKSLFNFGFYDVITSTIRKKNKHIDEIIGHKIEKLISEKLTSKNITHFNNEKYKTPSEFRKKYFEINQQRKDGECDIIIETDSSIIFLEIKKKILTRQSLSGSVAHILNDLSKSYFAAQVQIGWHESILRENDFIEFDSGKKLELRGRDIERIAVSLFDFYSFNDNFLLSELLRGLINSRVDVDDYIDKSLIKDINKNLDELRFQFRLPIMEHYNSEGNPFINLRFFSIPQLLTIIDNSNNPESFRENIFKTRHITTGCKDWYKEFDYVKKLRS